MKRFINNHKTAIEGGLVTTLATTGALIYKGYSLKTSATRGLLVGALAIAVFEIRRGS